jgi:hypothetical protein
VPGTEVPQYPKNGHKGEGAIPFTTPSEGRRDALCNHAT